MANNLKTWFLAPTWDIAPGSVKLGTIFFEPTPAFIDQQHAKFTPTDEELGALPSETTKDEFTANVEEVKENKGGVFARFLGITPISADLTAETDKSVVEHFSVKKLTSVSGWVPSTELQDRAASHGDVATYLEMWNFRKPVYMITGIRIAEGVKITTLKERGRNIQGWFGLHKDTGTGGESTTTQNEFMKFEGSSPIVFAYQLREIYKIEGGTGGSDYVAKALLQNEIDTEGKTTVVGTEKISDQSIDHLYRYKDIDEIDKSECICVGSTPISYHASSTDSNKICGVSTPIQSVLYHFYEYGIFTYKSILAKHEIRQQNDLDDLNDINTGLGGVSGKYLNILADIVEEKVLTAHSGRELQKATEAMEVRLGFNLKPFESAVNLVKEQVSEVFSILRIGINQEIRAKLLNLSGLESATGQELFQSVLDDELKDFVSVKDLKQRWKNARKELKKIPLKDLFSKLNIPVDRLYSILQRPRSRSLPKEFELTEFHKRLSILSNTISEQKNFLCDCNQLHKGYFEIEDDLLKRTLDTKEHNVSTFKFIVENLSNESLASDSIAWKWASLTVTMSLVEQQKSEPPRASQSSPNTISLEQQPLPSFKLCEYIEESQKNSGRLGSEILDAEAGKIRLRYNYKQPQPPCLGMINMEQAYEQRLFTVSHRLQLAIKVAETLLCLYNTALLPNIWLSRDIWLHKPVDERSQSTSSIFLLANSPKGDNSNKDILTQINGSMEPRVLSLGFVLMELAMNHPWSFIRQTCDPELDYSSNPNELSDHDIAAIQTKANKLKEKNMNGNISDLLDAEPMFFEVIRKCVLGDLHDIDFSGCPHTLQNPSFRKVVYDQVVSGLRDAAEDYEFASKKTTNMNGTCDNLFDDIQSYTPEKCKLATKWVYDFRKDVLPFLEESEPKLKEQRRVRIAILDTGLDINHDFIKTEKKRIRCKSFLDNKNAEEDIHGHGTHISGLILRLAPNANLFVYRVAENNVFTDKNIKAIASALEQAKQDEIDIISISLGFKQKTKTLLSIQEALLSAYAHKIIIFAAASNSGATVTKLAYPANQNEVIWIGSSDGLGVTSGFTPSHTVSNTYYKFTALGEGVNSFWPTGLTGENCQVRSGTSYATPIAAAIAAAVIDFIRFKLIGAAQGSTDSTSLQALRTKKMMEKVLKLMTIETTDGYHFLQPSSLFHDYNASQSKKVLRTIVTCLEDQFI